LVAAVLREAEPRQSPVEDAGGVVHLAVAQQVDDRARPAHCAASAGGVAVAAAFAAAGSASSITCHVSSSRAAETNHASKARGGGYTPRASSAWKRAGSRHVAAAWAPA